MEGLVGMDIGLYGDIV